MEFSRPDSSTVLLARLDPVLIDLLRRITPSADTSDSEAAHERIYSPPTHDDAEKELVNDWRRYIEPELQKFFRTSLELIDTDLHQLHINKARGEGSLALPIEHLEEWINGLNQARLALTARHEFGEEEMENGLSTAGDARSLALLQVRFYGILQELFLRELE